MTEKQYRVIEVAQELGVSKVTIYKKLSKFKKELKPFIVKKQNITFILEEGVEFIRQSLIDNAVIQDDSLHLAELERVRAQYQQSRRALEEANNVLLVVNKEHIEDLQWMHQAIEKQLRSKRRGIQEKEKIAEQLKSLTHAAKDMIAKRTQQLEGVKANHAL